MNAERSNRSDGRGGYVVSDTEQGRDGDVNATVAGAPAAGGPGQGKNHTVGDINDNVLVGVSHWMCFMCASI
jgi:hypothetical protein